MTAIRWDRSALLSEIRPDTRNRAALIPLIGTGKVRHAVDGPDGRMHADIHIHPGEPVWDPAVLVLPHGGDVDIEFYNDDVATHSTLMPSNGANVWIWLPVHSHGRVRLNLDGPGCYWYGSGTGRAGVRAPGAVVVLGGVTRT